MKGKKETYILVKTKSEFFVYQLLSVCTYKLFRNITVI